MPTDPGVARCAHGAAKDGAYVCPDCTRPKPQHTMAADERLRRWLEWAQAVCQPLGVGASDDAMRRNVFAELTTRAQTARRMVTIPAACQLLGVSRRTIYNWIESGSVEYRRTAGGTIRIFEDTLWRGPDKES